MKRSDGTIEVRRGGSPAGSGERPRLGGVPRRVRLAAIVLITLFVAACGQGASDAPGHEASKGATADEASDARSVSESPDAKSSTAPPGPHSAAPVGPTRKPHVFVILVDTLRADSLGFAGYSRATSPRLDRWAARGFVFEQATTPAGWTRPAVVSLFSGLYPATHGVQDKEHVAPDEIMMLAEVFAQSGYDTAAFVTNFAVDRQFGCMQGFDTYRWFDKKVDSGPAAPKQLNYVPVGDIDSEIRDFLDGPHERPVFAYIHTTDPHFPYLPPPQYLKWGTDPRGRYDGEVLYTDSIIGGWLDLLAERGLLDESIVILTADHGEEFGEHGGTGHGITVFEECVRVPLVVWAPGLAPGRSRALVSLADVPPTLLEMAGVPAPPGFARQARSFRGLMTGGPAADWNRAYSELVYPSKGIAYALREGDEKVVHIVRDKVGRRQWTGLFDLRRDPSEQTNLTPSRAGRAGTLMQSLLAERDAHLALSVESRSEPLDEEATEKLRALGYIE